ncbi:MAG: MXAN_5187 C-terminal domain-containing protein [Thermodesulfobacteriota bacterium]
MDANKDLETLEKNLTKLKIAYEQYFMRILKLEPLKLRTEVEMTIRRYTGKTMTNTAFKFKFNNLVAKFNAFKQYWTRTLRAIEEGTYARRAESAMVSSQGAGETNSETTNSVTRDIKPRGVKRRPDGPDNNRAEKKTLDRVYKEYVEAMGRSGGPAKNISFEKFTETVKKSREKIARTYGVKETELKVIEKDGRVKLAISPGGKSGVKKEKQG